MGCLERYFFGDGGPVQTRKVLLFGILSEFALFIFSAQVSKELSCRVGMCRPRFYVDRQGRRARCRVRRASTFRSFCRRSAQTISVPPARSEITRIAAFPKQ
jgi:hypothetical protein